MIVTIVIMIVTNVIMIVTMVVTMFIIFHLLQENNGIHEEKSQSKRAYLH